MRRCAILLASVLFSAAATMADAQTQSVLPEAPVAPVPTTTANDVTNLLPVVNGRHYRPPTGKEQFQTFLRRSIGFSAFAGPGVSSAINLGNNHPKEWGQDAAGYGQRFATSFGQNAIQSTTRYALGAALHEDNRYLVCHDCTVRNKLKNALLADVSARHGADGHRVFSPTGILAGFSGPLVSYSVWYPSDPDYGTARGARSAAIGFATRPAAHFAIELLDHHRIPFTHREIGEDSPTRREQEPTGWQGPLPPKS